MNNVTIITDSISDLNFSTLNEYNIISLPIKIDIDGTLYRDKIDISNEEFYKIIREKNIFPKTSQISPSEFEEVFSNELNKGNKVICVTVSSYLSGTYNSAHIAKNNLESDDIFIIDSLSATVGQGLIVVELAKYINKAKNIEELLEYSNKLINNQKSIIGVDSLEMLKRGGRIPKSLATISTLLDIKPLLTLKDGHLEAVSKVRGMKSLIKNICKTITTSNINKEYSIIIAHANNTSHCNLILETLKEQFPDVEILTSEVGIAVGCHIGEGALAVFIQEKN